MNKQQIEQKTAELVANIIQGTDVELVAVEYVRERDWYLRVFLDRPGGIALDDCASVNRELNKVIDEAVPIAQQYYLEVSSPGLDRALSKPRDFERNIGKKIDLNFFAAYNGQKNVTGILVLATPADIIIESDGNQQTIPLDKVAVVKLHIDF